MENNAWIAIAVCALLLGGLIGAVAFPKTIVEEKTVTVTEQVEVPVEVEVIKEVEVDTTKLLKDAAVDDWLAHMEEEELFECSGDEYDVDEVSLSKVYDAWTVTFDEDETTVDFSAKLKYKESDLKSCRESYDVEVFYEPDEDPVVTIK